MTDRASFHDPRAVRLKSGVRSGGVDRTQNDVIRSAPDRVPGRPFIMETAEVPLVLRLVDWYQVL